VLGRLGWKLVSFRLETAIGVLRRGMATDSRTRADLRGRALCSPSLPGAAADNEHEAKAPRACINQTAGVSACQRHSGRSGSISSCLWAALAVPSIQTTGRRERVRLPEATLFKLQASEGYQRRSVIHLSRR
jgi:hypothetical protein